MQDPAPPGDDDPDAQALRDLNAAPINPLPAVVWILLLLIAAVELVIVMAAQGWIGGPQGIGWRVQALERFAFSGAVQDWMLETRRAPPRHLVRYLAYPFIQPGTLPAVFVLVMLAGLGKVVGERLGNLTLLVCALVPPVLAAILFGLILADHDLAWLIGGWPMVFGLVGAFTWSEWLQAGGDAARQRRAFGLIGVLMLARLGFGLLAETGHGWIADLAAFGFGFVLAWALQPGGWARLRHRLRQR